MSIRNVQFLSGEYYHIYNRGNSKQNIFHEEKDYAYFVDLLLHLNTERRIAMREIRGPADKEEMIISIGAFCLMPNHFHILIKQEKDSGITKFMQKVSTAYVMYYNKKYKRTGSLFEGKFKSKYAGEDRYLKYLFSYIHLNPLKLIDNNWKLNIKSLPNKVEFLGAYKYSSFIEYYTNMFNIVNKPAFPQYFETKEIFMKEICSWFYQFP